MSELLTALVAAAKVGFEAPKCNACYGNGSNFSGHTFVDIPCEWCLATGLDASDPERLIGRAFNWLLGKNAQVAANEAGPAAAILTWVGFDAISIPYAERTPEGRATALLRLVARVGGEA